MGLRGSDGDNDDIACTDDRIRFKFELFLNYDCDIL